MSLNILGSCIRKKATHTPNIATILVRELYSANICEYSAPGSCIRNCSPNIATPGSYIRKELYKVLQGTLENRLTLE